ASNFRKEKAINGFIGYLTIFEDIMFQLPLVLGGAYEHPSIGGHLMAIKDDDERGEAAMSANKSQFRYLLEQIEVLEERYEEITKALESDSAKSRCRIAFLLALRNNPACNGLGQSFCDALNLILPAKNKSIVKLSTNFSYFLINCV